MKQQIIIATVLLFIFGASLYAAENTAQAQGETQQIDLTMTASTGHLFLTPRFYINRIRYNFDEIQRVFDVTDELTKKLFYQAKKVWWTTFKNGFESENELVKKTVESYNRFITSNAENRAKVLAVIEKMQREEEQERETRTRERYTHFESRKNEFIGFKIVLGCHLEPKLPYYLEDELGIRGYLGAAAHANLGFRYARFYGNGAVAHGFIFEAATGTAFIPSMYRFTAGLNLMYGLKTGNFYLGLGTFFYYTLYSLGKNRESNFDSGLILVLGRELRGLGKTKFFIGMELKGTPFALMKRLPDTSRIRYFSIGLEMGVGY